MCIRDRRHSRNRSIGAAVRRDDSPICADPMNSNRRQFATTAAGLAGAAATWSTIRRNGPDVRKARSRVAILSVEGYSDALETLLLAALRDFGLNAVSYTHLT